MKISKVFVMLRCCLFLIISLAVTELIKLNYGNITLSVFNIQVNCVCTCRQTALSEKLSRCFSSHKAAERTRFTAARLAAPCLCDQQVELFTGK